jgi:hypothetical protein
MLDHPDYQALSSAARLTLLTLRLCSQNTAASIFRPYPAVLCVQTGLSLRALAGALAELEAGAWIEREGHVVWIRNGLRYDPNLRLSDDKHRAAVLRALEALPSCALVGKFCEYYRITRPLPGPGQGLARPWQDRSPPRRRRSRRRNSEKEGGARGGRNPDGLSAPLTGSEGSGGDAGRRMAEGSFRGGAPTPAGQTVTEVLDRLRATVEAEP